LKKYKEFRVWNKLYTARSREVGKQRSEVSDKESGSSQRSSGSSQINRSSSPDKQWQLTR
jgi:hypothetical protein